MSHTHSYVSLPLTECLQWRGGSRSKTKKKKQYLDKQQEVGVGGGAKEREVFRLFGLSGNSSCFHLLILGLLSCQVREDKWQESKAENMVQR